MADCGIRWHTHDPGVVLTHLGVAIADGADRLADMALLKEQEELAAQVRRIAQLTDLSKSRERIPQPLCRVCLTAVIRRSPALIAPHPNHAGEKAYLFGRRDRCFSRRQVGSARKRTSYGILQTPQTWRSSFGGPHGFQVRSFP